MDAYVVQHVPFEGPAMIAEVLAERGAQVQVVRTYLGESLPAAQDVDVLVVMGGPMGALDDEEYPNLPRERALLRDCVEREIPVLGVCLGAQLLAAALGARVYAGAEPEIGIGTVTLTAKGRADGLFGDLREAGGEADVPVMHWHQDTFDLPTGATLLAGSSAYEHQAFRIGSAYGLQFHVEMDDAAFAAVAEHLDPGVHLDADARRQVEEAGRPTLRRWAQGLTS